MMKDVSNDELKQIERISTRSRSIPKQNNDEQNMLDMVQKIKEGGGLEKIQQKIIEPEMPKSQPIVDSGSSNYWKISGLPSKEKFYPVGTEIQGRPLKVLEIKKISSMTEDNGDFILNDIIRRTIKGINPDELYVADKLFIIFWLRANSYRESGYVVPFICPKCDKKSEYHFEIDNMEVQQISDEFDPRNEITLPNNDKVRYDYLKIKDELYINRFKELNRQMISTYDDELLSMSQMIKSINGKELSLVQKYDWLTEINPGDYSYLKTKIEKDGMGIKTYINVECKECGGTGAVPVSFRPEFFIAEYKAE